MWQWQCDSRFELQYHRVSGRRQLRLGGVLLQTNSNIIFFIEIFERIKHLPIIRKCAD